MNKSHFAYFLIDEIDCPQVKTDYQVSFEKYFNYPIFREIFFMLEWIPENISSAKNCPISKERQRQPNRPVILVDSNRMTFWFIPTPEFLTAFKNKYHK